MGTPDFAVESLKQLVDAGKNIVGVITMPDKPAGRGHKLQASAVKQYAVEAGIKVLQPESLKDENFLEELRTLKADLQIVVAFRMLPEVVWNMPTMGTFNLHGSLLPKYRGAAPINWAIINGEEQTGITTFFLKHEIDTGDIIYQDSISIDKDDNAGTIHDKLMYLGAELVLRTVNAIESGTVPSTKQRDIEACPAPKIFKDTCRIDFYNLCDDIRNHVRGLSPYPTAWTNIIMDNDEELTLKVFSVHNEICSHDKEIGTVLSDGKKFIKVATVDGYTHLDEVQLSGKKRMHVEDLLRGMKMRIKSITPQT